MTYRDEIAQMLRRMPSDWNRQYRSGRAQLGVALPDVPSPEQAMMLIGITAGGRESGDSPIGKNRVPRDVRDAAMKGLRLSYANNYGAWNFIGIARAIELALMPAVSDTTTSRMHNYLFRHQKDKAGKNFGNDTTPSRGYMAWLNWGGDPAVRWLGVPTMRQNPKRYSLVVRTPGFPELDVVKGTYSSLKEAQDAVTLGKLKLHRPWRKHGEEYQWSAAKNLWAVPDDAPRPTEWSYKVVQMPPTKYVGKHWRLEIAQKGMVVEVYKTDSRKSAEQMGDLILSKRNRRKNPMERGGPGLQVFEIRTGQTSGMTVLVKAGANISDLNLTDILGMVQFNGYPHYAEVYLGAAQRGWGVLLYNLAAMSALNLFGSPYLIPSDQRSAEAKAFWKRLAGSGERLFPPGGPEFEAKFGYPRTDLNFDRLNIGVVNSDPTAEALRDQAFNFFRFNYKQDQDLGMASLRPNEYVESLTEKVQRVTAGDRKKVILIPPFEVKMGAGTYLLVEPSKRNAISATDILGYASVYFDPEGRSLRVQRITAPAALRDLMLDAIKFDADDNGVDEVYDGASDIVLPLGLSGFKKKHGIDARKMMTLGNALRNVLKAKVDKSQSWREEYPGEWARDYYEKALFRGTPEQPLRLNRGKYGKRR